MKLFLISQSVNEAYDTYDSAVVAAESEEQAKMTHPSKNVTDWDGTSERWGSWTEAANVQVKLIGEALPETPAGVICASFNAG